MRNRFARPKAVSRPTCHRSPRPLGSLGVQFAFPAAVFIAAMSSGLD
jgi:hypothetical protein